MKKSLLASIFLSLALSFPVLADIKSDMADPDLTLAQVIANAKADDSSLSIADILALMLEEDPNQSSAIITAAINADSTQVAAIVTAALNANVDTDTVVYAATFASNADAGSIVAAALALRPNELATINDASTRALGSTAGGSTGGATGGGTTGGKSKGGSLGGGSGNGGSPSI